MVNKVNILFWGYDRSAEDKLKVLAGDKLVRLVGLVVPTNRDETVVNKISSLAAKLGINILNPGNLKDPGFMDEIRQRNVDAMIVDSYSRLIPQEILDLAGQGGFNFHPGKLPEYRGAHVMNWAIINGEDSLTLTLHRMSSEFDSGEIILEEKIPISCLDDINSVYKKVVSAGNKIVKQLIRKLTGDDIQSRPQSNDGARHYHARKPEDGRIDWRQDNKHIYDLIRALADPWPNAFFIYKGKTIKVQEAYPAGFDSGAAPGTVLAVSKKALCVAAGKGTILIKKAEQMDFDEKEILQ